MNKKAIVSYSETNPERKDKPIRKLADLESNIIQRLCHNCRKLKDKDKSKKGK